MLEKQVIYYVFMVNIKLLRKIVFVLKINVIFLTQRSTIFKTKNRVMRNTLLWVATFVMATLSTFAQSGWVAKDAGIAAGNGIGQISVGLSNTDAVWAQVLNNDGSINDSYTLSVDGGLTWTAGTFDAGSGLSQLFAIDENTCWAVFNTGANQGLYKTVNGGTNWVKKGDVYGASSFANVVHFFDENNGFAQGDPLDGYFELYTTTDGGETWTRVPEANIAAPVAGEYGITGNYDAKGNSIWFGTNKGRVYYSSDKGLNWAATATPFGDGETVQIKFKDEQNGVAFRSFLNLGIEEKLNVTTDGGATWTELIVTGDMYARYFSFIPGTDVLVGSAAKDDAMGIAYSEDMGANWTTISTEAPFLGQAWFDQTTGIVGTWATANGGGILLYDGFPIGSTNLDPPVNLNANVNGQDVSLSWMAPGGGGVGLTEGFEDAFPPAGWSVTVTNSNATYQQVGVISFSSGDVTPHGGESQVYLPWDYSAQDEWIMTPAFAADASTSLTFWGYMAYGSPNGDHYYVKVSTDNGTTWTEAWDASALPEGENHYAEAIVIDLASYAGQNIMIAWNAVDGDGQGLWFSTFIDDVSVATADETIHFNEKDLVCVSKSKKSAHIVADRLSRDNSSVVSTPKATDDVTGYNVYRNGSKITATPVTGTSYSDAGLDIGEYTYFVTAVYPEGESGASNAAVATIGAPSISVDPTSITAELTAGGSTIKNFTISNEGNSELTFDLAIAYDNNDDAEYVLHYDGENADNGIGSSAGGTFEVAARFPAATMAAFNGSTLDEVRIFLNDAGSDAKVKIYKDGATGDQPGDLLGEQTFTGNVADWTNVALGTPISLDGSGIWIAYEVTLGPAIYALGCDAGPHDPNGQWIYSGGSWAKLADLAPSLTYNWNIRGVINGTFVAPWLSVNPINGAIAADDDLNIDAIIDATDLEAGEYNATITVNSNDATNPAVDVDVTLGVTDGIEDNTQVISMIYPVPAQNTLTIKTNSNIQSVRVVNYNGQVVMNNRFNGMNAVTLNVSALSSGLYFVETETENGVITQKVTIK